jgi:hypothetical protein
MSFRPKMEVKVEEQLCFRSKLVKNLQDILVGTGKPHT